MIRQHRPRDADHAILLQDLLDQEASTDRAAETGRARLVLIIEAADELGAAALVAGLHEHRPASLIRHEQLGAAFQKGCLQLVKDGIGSHAALWHGL